jgi:hypothetical protein
VRNDALLEQTIQNTIKQMQTGKTFSSVVDVRGFVKEFPDSRSLVEFLDSVMLVPDDCYMTVVKRLQIDCERAKVDMLDNMSLQFTRCYFDILGQSSKIPEVPGRTVHEYTATMSRAEYAQFKAIQNHAISLCHYARQNIINVDITKHLVGLFESVLSSQRTAQEMNATLGITWKTVNQSVADLQEKIIEGDYFIRNITDQVVSLSKLVNETFETLRKPAKHIEFVKLVLLWLIVIVLLGLFLPQFLLPLIGMSILHDVLKFIGRRYIQTWSRFHVVGDIVYIVLAGGYPLYKMVNVVRGAGSLLLRASNLKQEPVVSFPRITQARARPGLARPRAF